MTSNTMANVFDELYKMTHTPEAIAARQARRAQRATTLDRIAEALGTKTADSWDIQDLQLERRPLGDVHPGAAAAVYVREALGQFDLPDRVKVSYVGMKRQSGSGAHRMKDGVAMVRAEVSSLSGARHYLDVPVMVHAGYMVYPEIFMHNGRVRVMAQSAFDDIIGAGEVMRGQPDRKHMYSAPPAPEDTLRSRAEPPTAQVGTGMYGIRAALRGYNTKTAGPDGQAYIEGTPNANDHKNVGWQGNPNDDHLDEAERDRSTYLTPGQAVTLANAVTLKGRGGTTNTLKSGTKGTIVRDMLGTGQVYYVEFDGGGAAPVNREDLA